MKNLIIALVGPSGVGKGYLKERLKRSFRLKEPPVFTTRQNRKGEKNAGRVFLSREEFIKRQRNGEFVFPQELYGNHYAFDRSAFSKGGIITEVHIGITEQFRKMFPTAIIIAMVPENLAFLSQRLRKRGDSPREARKRMRVAASEISRINELAKNFDIKYAVGFGNEGRIVQEVTEQLKVKIANARNKTVRQKARKPPNARFGRAWRKKGTPHQSARVGRGRGR